jgi:AraC family transcriptional activator of pobA
LTSGRLCEKGWVGHSIGTFRTCAKHPPPSPVYGLFGGNHAPSPAGFAHIETIAERSSLHDWEISPHRHERGIQVLIVSAGHAEVTLDGARFALVPPAYVVLPAGSVHGFRFSPGTHGHVLTLSLDFAGRARGADDPLRHLLTKGGHGTMGDNAARRVELLAGEMNALAQEWHDGHLFLALAEALARSLPDPELGAQSADDAASRNSAIWSRCICANIAGWILRQQHRLYPRTLGRLCHARLGNSPLEVIHRRLGVEAQRLLRYTNASVTQIAQELGFADPSYFRAFTCASWVSGLRRSATTPPEAHRLLDQHQGVERHNALTHRVQDHRVEVHFRNPRFGRKTALI